MSMLSIYHLVSFSKKYPYHIYSVVSQKNVHGKILTIGTIFMVATLLLEYYDADSPIQSHIYSHTSSATVLDLFPIENLSLMH
jgi:hypothetical protein